MKEIKALKDNLDFANASQWSVHEWSFWLDYVIAKKQATQSDVDEAYAAIDHRLELLTAQLQNLLQVDQVAKEDSASDVFGQAVVLNLRTIEATEKDASKCIDSNFKRTIYKVVAEFKPIADKIKELESLAVPEAINHPPKLVVKDQPKPAAKETARPTKTSKPKSRKS